MKKKRKETFVSLLLKDGFDNDIKEDDTTFNELNDRTRDLTEELKEILEPVKEETKEDKKEEEMVIESNFPKIDKLGSVTPHIVK